MANSKFGFLGAIRNACQRVSYEISIRFQILRFILILFSITIKSFFSSYINLNILLLSIWWIFCICECNRAPFDFAEGERELIRGFNVEYSSIGFIFIFLGEYGIIIRLSLITTFFFFLNNIFIYFILFLSLILFRTSYPRFRFDLLIQACWLIFLPLVIRILLFCLFL